MSDLFSYSYSLSLSLFASTKSHDDMELLFKQLHLLLTPGSVRLSLDALNVLLQRNKESVQNGDSSPEVLFMREVQKELFGDVPLLRPLTNSLLDVVTLDKMQELYDAAFTERVSNFVFCFVLDGTSDSQVEEFKQMVEKYLGCLSDNVQSDAKKVESGTDTTATTTAAAAAAAPTAPVSPSSHPQRWSLESHASPSPLGVVLPTTYIEKHIHERVANKATSMLCLPVPKLPLVTVALDHAMKMTCKVLRNRLLSSIRQQQSDVYNISAEWNHSHMSPHGAVVISWSCLPANNIRVKEAVLREIHELKMNGPKKEELESVVAIEKRRIQGTTENSSYWLFHMLDGYKTQKLLLGGCIQEEEEEVDSTAWVETQIGERAPSGAVKRLGSMTMESIQSMFVQYMNTDTMLNAVLGPRDTDESKTHGAGGESAKM